MPTLTNVAEALRRYTGRYQFLDAFADDVDELRNGELEGVPTSPAGPGEVAIDTTAGRIFMRIFPDQGIARFRLADQHPRSNNDPLVAGAALGALVGAAVSSASTTKEGLLGGLIVGMLVGGIVAAQEPVERVLALRFDQPTGSWQVYDGPLLRWAKRTLYPATPPAA